MIGGPSLHLAHAAATLAMTGLIWFVQLVHYPLFRLADRHRFERFAVEHQRRTAWVVLPLMTLEAATATLLLARQPGVWTVAGWLLVAAIWLSTAVLQVPLHRRLARGWDPAAARRLVAGNWIRTVAWTARGLIALLLIASPESI